MIVRPSDGSLIPATATADQHPDSASPGSALCLSGCWYDLPDSELPKTCANDPVSGIDPLGLTMYMPIGPGELPTYVDDGLKDNIVFGPAPVTPEEAKATLKFAYDVVVPPTRSNLRQMKTDADAAFSQDPYVSGKSWAWTRLVALGVLTVTDYTPIGLLRRTGLRVGETILEDGITHGAEAKLAEIAALRGSPTSFYKYNELKGMISAADLSGQGLGFEAHHLVEKQFAKRIGVAEDEILSVALTPKWHRNVGGFGINFDATITSELKALGTSPKDATIKQIWLAHKNVYGRAGYSEWADAIYETYFKKLGVAK